MKEKEVIDKVKEIAPYDPEIGARSAAIGAVLGFVGSKITTLDQPTSTFIGTLVGLVYDYIAFRIKSHFATKS